MEYMTPPITLCESGHNICKSCRPNLDNCPTCRQPYLKVRNKALENLAQKVHYPCCYRSNGCSVVLRPDLIGDHQLSCHYRPYYCPLSKAEGIECKWVGELVSLKKHIQTEHRDRLTDLKSVKKVVIMGYKSEHKYSRVIFACNEMFYQQFEVKDSVFYFVIQHIGPENYDLKFQYNFTLATYRNVESVSATFVARSCKVSVGDIHRSGQCVKLCFETVKNFLDETNNFKFEFHIKKI